MTVRHGWLQRLICRQNNRTDSTETLITEAERTRRELLRITERLAGHVAQLQAFTRAYSAARPVKGPPRG